MRDRMVATGLLVLVLVASAEAYDPALSQQAMLYSATAYCDPLALQTWSCRPCASLPGVQTVAPVAMVEKTSFTYGYVTYSTTTRTLVVSFRGTRGLPDSPSFRSVEAFFNWITNLNFQLVPYNSTSLAHRSDDHTSPPMVHAGFYQAYLSVAMQMRTHVIYTLAQVGGPSGVDRVLVTGHSLGGALATFAALDLVERGVVPPGKIHLHTFGCPRVGNPEFADLFTRNVPAGSSMRVVHANDMVPHLPPKKMQFIHSGEEIWYPGESAQWQKCAYRPPTAYEDMTCSDYLSRYGISAHMEYLGANITSMC